MAITGIVGTIALLQDAALTVPGIRYAPSGEYPPSLDTSLLPAVLTFPEFDTTRPVTMGLNLRTFDRTFQVVCFVDASGQSTSNARVILAYQLLDAMKEVIRPNRQLNALTRIFETRDTGIVAGANVRTSSAEYLSYNGQQYTGFVISVRVMEFASA